jgi:hypothetical protein
VSGVRKKKLEAETLVIVICYKEGEVYQFLIEGSSMSYLDFNKGAVQPQEAWWVRPAFLSCLHNAQQSGHGDTGGRW